MADTDNFDIGNMSLDDEVGLEVDLDLVTSSSADMSLDLNSISNMAIPETLATPGPLAVPENMTPPGPLAVPENMTAPGPLAAPESMIPTSLDVDTYLSQVDFDNRVQMESRFVLNSETETTWEDSSDSDDDDDSMIMFDSAIRFDEIPEHNVVYDNQMQEMEQSETTSNKTDDSIREMKSILQERGYIGLHDPVLIMQFISRELYRLGNRYKSLGSWLCSEHLDYKNEVIRNVDIQGCQNKDVVEQKSIEADIQDYKTLVNQYASEISRAYDLAYDVVANSSKKENLMRRIQSVKIPAGYDDSLPQVTLTILTEIINVIKPESKEDYQRVILTTKERVSAAYSSAILDLYEESTERYVKTILDIYLDSNKIDRADEHKQQVHKSTTIRQITDKLKNILLDLDDKLSQGKLRFVKQIMLCNNKYCILDDNNNFVEISEPIFHCAMVKVKNTFVINSLPLPIAVGDYYYILNENDVANVTKALMNLSEEEGSILSRYKDFQVANCSKLIHSFSKFSATKLHVIFKQINEERKGRMPIYPLFTNYDEDIVTIEETTEDDKTATNTLNLIADDIEYGKAIKDFCQYLKSIPVSEVQLSKTASNKELTGQSMTQKLNSLAGEKIANKIRTQNDNNFQSSVSLSYRKIATFIASCLSLDYVHLKNQALFSLIYQITDNPFLNFYLNRNGFINAVINANNYVKRLEKVTAATISNMTVVNFNSICDIANKHNLCLDITDNRSLDEDAKNKAYTAIKERLPELKQTLTTLEEENEINFNTMIDILEKSEKALIFTKIIHCSSIKTIDFECILCNPKLNRILDRIADRMICTNYADKFYEQFIHLSFFNPSDYISSLDKFEMANKLRILYGATSAKRTVSFGPLMREEKASFADFMECFSYMSDISILPANEYNPLERYVKDFNVYKIVRAIKNIDRDIKYFGEDFQELLEESLDTLCSKLDMSIPERYSNTLEFALSIAGFQSEELVDFRLDDHKLKFTRFILKREDGEEIADYITRYNTLLFDNKLNAVNSVDMLRYLLPVYKELNVISFVSYLTNIEYSDYLKSAMITSIVEFCHECARFDCAHQLLGIDPAVSLILANKKYKPSLAFDNFADYAVITTALCETPLDYLIGDLGEKYNSAIIESKFNLEHYRSKFDIYGLVKEIQGLMLQIEEGEKQIYMTITTTNEKGEEIKIREPIEALDSEVTFMLDELESICPSGYQNAFSVNEKHE